MQQWMFLTLKIYVVFPIKLFNKISPESIHHYGVICNMDMVMAVHI